MIFSSFYTQHQVKILQTLSHSVFPFPLLLFRSNISTLGVASNSHIFPDVDRFLDMNNSSRQTYQFHQFCLFGYHDIFYISVTYWVSNNKRIFLKRICECIVVKRLKSAAMPGLRTPHLNTFSSDPFTPLHDNKNHCNGYQTSWSALCVLYVIALYTYMKCTTYVVSAKRKTIMINKFLVSLLIKIFADHIRCVQQIC